MSAFSQLVATSGTIAQRYRVRKATFERAPRARFVAAKAALLSFAGGAIVAAIAWFAFAVDDLWLGSFLLCIAVSLLLLLCSIWFGVAALRVSRVVVGREGPLRFAANIGFLWPMLGSGVFMMAAGVLGVLSRLLPGIEPIASNRITGGVIALLVIGCVLVLDPVLRLCTPGPRGLRLGVDGLEWRSWGRLRQIRWDQMQGAALTRSMLRLETEGGAFAQTNLLYVSADPVLVAETVRYFLATPSTRQSLHDPRAALALVLVPEATTSAAR